LQAARTLTLIQDAHIVSLYDLGMRDGRPFLIMEYLEGQSLSAVVVAMVAGVGAGVAVHAWRYFPPGHERDFFWPLWLTLACGLGAVAVVGDVFNLYVAFEVTSIAAVGLVALGHGAVARVAAERYVLVALGGSLVYLLAVALLYAEYGVLDMAELAARVRPSPTTGLALALAMAGLSAKAALLPLHGWLPPAHASAPAPASALLSALVVKAAIYAQLRLGFTVFAGARTPALDAALGALGVGAIVWGSLLALRQRRLKGVVAYSTVGQLGYPFLAFPMAGTAGASAALAGAVYFLLAHACAKAALFLAAGNVQRALGHDRVEELRGAGAALPMTFLAFALASLSLMGLPPSGGFVAKWLLLRGALEAEAWALAVVIVGGGLLAAGYLLRVLALAMAVPSGPPPTVARVPRTLEAVALALALAAVALGLVSSAPLALLEVGAPEPLGTLGRRRP
ncbi:oxidoreductase, partial [Myxococcus sp. AM009]|uniref:complex I subunit 5 family protein n=1 Tax=Myxococcus sp. AM009 TaxID=2745137 RepID=UPI00159538D3